MRSARREKVDAPVLCVGNFTVGGTGKTPVAIALAKQAQAHAAEARLPVARPWRQLSPSRISSMPHHDSARHVGDEPLLLAEHAPVAVTPNRAAGAKLLLEKHGCDFLIMDDGFQSARIHIDYALVVVDARYGIGNGHVIPGGPLRAPLVDQLRFADALLKMGEGTAADAVVRQAARAGKPIFEAQYRARATPEALAGKRFLAFAGIGHPEKFFDTVRDAGGDGGADAARFRDHHFYAAGRTRRPGGDGAGRRPRTWSPPPRTPRACATARRTGLSRAARRAGDRCGVRARSRSRQRIIDETLDAWRRRQASWLRAQPRALRSSGCASISRCSETVGVDIGLLARDAPIFELVERNRSRRSPRSARTSRGW